MKVRFHYSYILLVLSFILCGYFINIILFTLIILFHELGHLIMAKMNGYNINKITIYPYGGLINLDIKRNSPIKKELIVSIGGFLFQIILTIIFYYFYLAGIIRLYVYNIFVMYNTSILFFNMLPISSLDGSKILCLLLEYFIPYKYVLNIEFYMSLMSLFVFSIYKFNYSFLLVLCILIHKITICYRNKNYNFLSFIMERYLYNYTFKKVKVIKNIDSMYREKRHIFNINGKYIIEKDYLKYKFNVKNKKMFD